MLAQVMAGAACFFNAGFQIPVLRGLQPGKLLQVVFVLLCRDFFLKQINCVQDGIIRKKYTQ